MVGASNSTKGSAVALFSVATVAVVVGAAMIKRRLDRHERSKWVVETEQQEEIPSILDHFHSLQLDDTCSVDESNKRRTTKYYQLARDSVTYDLVQGISSYTKLQSLRKTEMDRIFKYRNLQQTSKPKSHRTVICMADDYTASLLEQARNYILNPLEYSNDIRTRGTWIPQASLVPSVDMHVTVAIPWWWHTLRPGNRQLSEELAGRFRQALVLEFHHPFQVELERIVLLGGKTLVALWRTVGERQTPDGETVYDRHGNGTDPFVKLRRDIVRCFTSTEMGNGPLTYTHRFSLTQPSPAKGEKQQDQEQPPPMPQGDALERENTIELKTPGLGDRDGFIHTTLARLPLDCLSMSDVELAPIHRLCREATATYCGHRLVINKFRFMETIGAGGESNPCKNPIFDETIPAPPRYGATQGIVNPVDGFSKTVDAHVTVGAPPSANMPNRRSVQGLGDLFHEPIN